MKCIQENNPQDLSSTRYLMSIEAILATILALQILCCFYMGALLYRLNKEWTRHVKRMESLVYELATGKRVRIRRKIEQGALF